MNRYILKHAIGECFDFYDTVSGLQVNPNDVGNAMLICQLLNDHDKRSKRLAKASARKAREAAEHAESGTDQINDSQEPQK